MQSRRHSDLALQRGRAHVSAERSRPAFNVARPSARLQRGRAHLSAESHPPGDISSSPSTVLQRGRAHVSAERDRVQTHVHVWAWLQRGRAHLSAESAKFADTTPGVQNASTGPRSRERGEQSGKQATASAWRASTGPRSPERGEDGERRRPKRRAMLQRGRAHLSAERRSNDSVKLVQFHASTGPRSRERGEFGVTCQP